MSFEGTRDLGDVRQRLAGYLGANVANLNVLASGWETTVFEFALNTPSLEADLPAGRLMVLRFYQGSNAAEKGPREYRVLCALAKSGYPAPRAYLFESALELFGVPFLIMDRSQGGPLLQLKSFPQAFKIFSLAFFDFVRAHAALHRLDPLLLDFAGIQRPFGTPSASSSATLLDRMLDTIAYRIEVGPLPGLAPMLEWARAQVPRFPCPRDSILHLDYHPQNAVVRGLRVTGILDWVNTDVGDRHLDVGTTCAILATSAMELAVMDATKRRGQHAEENIRFALSGTLPSDGAGRFRATALLPGGGGDAAAVDVRDDAYARSGIGRLPPAGDFRSHPGGGRPALALRRAQERHPGQLLAALLIRG